MSLDWYKPIESDLKEVTQLNESSPIALFIPGLTGDSQTEYIKTLIPQAQAHGFRCVGLNNRGRGGMELLTAKLYCGANCEDLELVLKHLKTKYPNSKIVATGISLGGGILCRYLVRSGSSSLVDFAMLYSVCWDFMAICETMEEPVLNMALNRHLAASVVHLVKEQKHLFAPLDKIDFDNVMKSRTIGEFDSRFTCKMWGFDKLGEYYCEATNKGQLHKIKVPTLCVSAADDMFSPKPFLPIQEITKSSHVAVVVTERGGHIGFMDGFFPFGTFYLERLARQVFEALSSLEDVRRDLS